MDDITLVGAAHAVTQVAKKLQNQFKMTDLQKLHHILGIEVTQTDAGIYLKQSQMIKKVLDKFNMADCNPVTTPQAVGESKLSTEDSKNDFPYRELVGSLQYLVSCTRPDLANVVRSLSKHLTNYTSTHWKMAKRVLRYLKSTENEGLFIKKSDKNIKIQVFADASYANEDSRRSVTGYVVMINDTSVIWKSRTQDNVASSSTTAEYIAAYEATCEVKWINNLLKELQIGVEMPITMFQDNKSTMAMIVNPQTNRRSKWIDIKCHFIREAVEEKLIQVRYCPANQMVADMFTKALPEKQFCYLRNQVMQAKLEYGVEFSTQCDQN